MFHDSCFNGKLKLNILNNMLCFPGVVSSSSSSSSHGSSICLISTRPPHQPSSLFSQLLLSYLPPPSLPPAPVFPTMAGRGGPARTNATAASNKICQFKLVLLGESAVGKSSLVLRFVKGQFHEYQESTIGGEGPLAVSAQ